MSVPYRTIPVDIEVLLLEPCHAVDNFVVSDIGNNKVNCMTLLHSGAILH